MSTAAAAIGPMYEQQSHMQTAATDPVLTVYLQQKWNQETGWGTSLY